MATYQSISSTTFTSGLTLTITKPSGLAVGDYMFAQVVSAGGTGWTTPSGWTATYNSNPNLSGASVPCGLFWKIADSADVAASNFSFTMGDEGGFTEQLSGCILRISNFGAFDGSNTTNGNYSTGTASYASGIDPTYPNGLLLAFFYGGDNAATTGMSVTSPAIATSNPTWTSRSSDSTSPAGRMSLRNVFTASRAADTAFGNFSFSVDDGSATDIGVLAILLNLAPRVNGADTVETGVMYVVNQPFLRTGALTIDATDPTDSSLNITQWTNDDKPTTTWVNTDK